MLSRLLIAGSKPAPNQRVGVGASPLTEADLAMLREEFPGVAVEFAKGLPDAPCPVTVDAGWWRAPWFDLTTLDQEIADAVAHGTSTVRIAGRCADVGGVCLEVLTRYQRYVGRRNAASETDLFDRILARHRMLYTEVKPPVRADYEHSVDTWQWLLRLEPNASLALQTAALFHDVDRTENETDAHTEHVASNYQSFKDAHARRGADIARAVLRDTGLDDITRSRVATLIEHHEHPTPERDVTLLNEADALSFFSLNCSGFVEYFGEAQARRKIAFSIGRLRPETRSRLARIRYRPDVQKLVVSELEPPPSASPSRPAA